MSIAHATVCGPWGFVARCSSNIFLSLTAWLRGAGDGVQFMAAGNSSVSPLWKLSMS